MKWLREMGRYRSWTGLDDIINDFNQLTNSKGNINQEFIDLVEDATLTLIRAESPADTGEYRDSWKTVNKSPTSLGIGTEMDDRVDILEEGTDAHRIEGNPYLAFPGPDGDTIVRKGVNHPGTDAQPHLSKVSQVMDSLILDFFEQLLAKYGPGIFQESIPRIKKLSNITSTVGLGKFTSLRGRGTILLHRIRTGRKRLQRRVGLRRRSGRFISSNTYKKDLVAQ